MLRKAEYFISPGFDRATHYLANHIQVFSSDCIGIGEMKWNSLLLMEVMAVRFTSGRFGRSASKYQCSTEDADIG
jgi:hypothetical protein